MMDQEAPSRGEIHDVIAEHLARDGVTYSGVKAAATAILALFERHSQEPAARDLGQLLDRASDDNELLRAEVERLRGHSQAAAVNDDPSIGDAILSGIASDDSSALEQMIAIKTNLERAGFAIVRRAEIRKWDALVESAAEQEAFQKYVDANEELIELRAQVEKSARCIEALKLLRSLVDEGGVPRYTVTPGAALNSVIEEDVDPALAALSSTERRQ